MKPGRKPTPIDTDSIADWATEGFRWPDIATEIGITDRSLRRIRAVNPEIDRAYEKGLARMRRSLRAKQYAVAMAGSVTMLIWLGKNELGQSDKLDTRSLHLHAEADSQDALAALTTEELRDRLATLHEIAALEEGDAAIEIEGELVAGGE